MLKADFQSAAFASEGGSGKEDGLPIFTPSVKCPSGFRLIVNRIYNDTLKIVFPKCLFVICPGMHDLDTCPWIVGIGIFGLAFHARVTC